MSGGVGSVRPPAIPFVEFWLKKYAQAEFVLLDIGCGVAQYRNTTPATYIGLDITDQDYRDGCSRDVDIVASATQMPLAIASCDLIFSVCAFYQIPDYMKALMEFHRVLKPGGRILLFDYNKRTQKVLQRTEGHQRPCWSQWGLKKLVSRSGFRECQLLLPANYEVNGMRKAAQLIKQELRGQWAIVTGIK